MTEKFNAVIKTDGNKQEVFDTITDYRLIDSFTDGVRVAGRGQGVGTRVYFNLNKSELNIPTRYTVKLEFTDYNEPNMIEWEVVEDIDAYGTINLNDSEDRVTNISVDFVLDNSNSDLGALPVPSSQSFSEVLDLIFSRISTPVLDVVKGIVQDIEDKDRPVDIEFSEVTDGFEPLLDSNLQN